MHLRAQLGTLPLAAYSIGYNLEPVLFMLPLGLSTGLANSVGNKLGAGQVKEAKRLTLIGLCVGGATVASYCSAVGFLGSRLIGGLFSQDAEVLAGAGEMWPSLTGFLMVSGAFGTVLVLNRGLGLQRANAICVLCIMWPIGAPLVLFNAHSPAQVWQNLCGMYTLLTAAMSLCSLCSSWTKLSDKAIASNVAAAGQPSSASSTEQGGTLEMAMQERCTAAGGLAAADGFAEEAAKAAASGVPA